MRATVLIGQPGHEVTTAEPAIDLLVPPHPERHTWAATILPNLVEQRDVAPAPAGHDLHGGQTSVMPGVIGAEMSMAE